MKQNAMLNIAIVFVRTYRDHLHKITITNYKINGS